jgi:formiminoglutamase
VSEDTLRYMRHDTTRRPQDGRRGRGNALGAKVVNLDGKIDPGAVRAVLLGVACDRGVGLGAGRLGSADGPQRFRDLFWRLIAPPGWGSGALLDAGDLVSAGRTDETHARLSEVVAVLRGRFPRARFAVIGGGQDALYGDVLGQARWLRGQHEEPALGLVAVDAWPDAASYDGEPHDRSAVRRILRERACAVRPEEVLLWGVQRHVASPAQLEFLRGQGVALAFWPDARGQDLAGELTARARRVHGLALSVDLGAFAQADAPGVSEPSALGVDPIAVSDACAALGALAQPTGLGVWGLNPRFDRDGATARLAARLVWSYLCAER